MFTEIVVNVNPLEKRVAIMEDNKLVELFVEKEDQKNIVGNVYKGIVKNVLPGMGAAFVDIGEDRTAFLHYSDIITDFFEDFEDERKNLVHIESDSSKIGDYIKEGQEIVVRVLKSPIGKKGARISGHISVPGKFIVFIPNNHRIAISRKIIDHEEKNRIRSILNRIKDPNVGLIVRTDAEGNTEEEFTQEYTGLYKTWRLLEKQIKYAKAPTRIFDDNELVNTLTRDIFSSKVDRLIVDDKKFKNKLIALLNEVSPELSNRVELYQEDSPIFDAYGIEKEIAKIFNSKIMLPNGGYLFIEQTEALVAIDVNTGSFTGNKNYEETIKQTNIEAAIEIARQIRLRDLSGIVVVDFIDMNIDQNKDEVMNVLKTNLKRDRAKNKVFPFSTLGLVEISRKKTKQSIINTFSMKCPYCNGSGRILSKESTVTHLFRWLQRAQYFIGNEPLKIFMHPSTVQYINENPSVLKKLHKDVELTVDNQLHHHDFRVFLKQGNIDITSKYEKAYN